MTDNPYCLRCGKHLGMPYHTTAEHQYAVSVDTPDEITSMLLTDEIAATVAKWCGGVTVVEHDAFDHSKTFYGVNVPTNHGVKRASRGDYVIQQEDGSFEVMGPADYQRSRSS